MTAVNIGRPQLTLVDRLDDPNVYARSSRAGVFTVAEVQNAIDMLDRVPIAEMLDQWDASDNKPRGPGGAPKTVHLGFHQFLVGHTLLALEDAPFLISELANLLWRRLDSDGRRLMRIDHIPVSDDHAREERLWYGRANAITRKIYKLIDPEPVPRRIGNVAERRYALAQIDPEDAAVKQERLEWFGNQLVDMTLRALPAEVLAAWQGDISVDQTKVPAVGKRGRRRWQKSKGLRIGPEPEGLLLMGERMDWYMHRPEMRNGNDPNDRDGTWGAAANFAVMTQNDPRLAPKHPLMAVAFNLGTPNNDALSEETVRLAASLQARGYPAGRITGDKEYFAHQTPERLALPIRALGYEPMTDYRSDRLGVRGGIGGAIQVEGKLYCPMMPTRLRDATKLLNEGKLTPEQYAKAVEVGRPQFEVRVKERPDENGTYPIVCPALGPAAKVDCWRPAHPKAGKKTRFLVTPPPEDKRDRICRNTSVSVPLSPAVRYLQGERYGTEEWRVRYSADRSAIEGYNAVTKDPSKHDLENTGRRRGRSWVNAAVAVAFILVAANVRMTNVWLREEAKRLAKPDAPYVRKTREFDFGIAKYKPRLPQMGPDGKVLGEEPPLAA